MVQHDSHISGAPVDDRLACGSMLQAVRCHTDRLQADVPAGVFAGGAVSGLARPLGGAPLSATTTAPVCRRYSAERTVSSHAITAWALNGHMWNQTHKFGPFDHFQRWRCAT
jgi:hypothetical protein